MPEQSRPADPEPARGEVVELAMWQGPHGNVVYAVPGTVADRDDDRPWTRLGTTRLPLVKGDAP